MRGKHFKFHVKSLNPPEQQRPSRKTRLRLSHPWAVPWNWYRGASARIGSSQSPADTTETDASTGTVPGPNAILVTAAGVSGNKVEVTHRAATYQGIGKTYHILGCAWFALMVFSAAPPSSRSEGWPSVASTSPD